VKNLGFPRVRNKNPVGYSALGLKNRIDGTADLERKERIILDSLTLFNPIKTY
jgi:hypothetical protein